MLYGRDVLVLAGSWPAVGSDGHYGSYMSMEWLFYEFVAVSIYEKQLQLGILNPYAKPFVPQGNYGREENQETREKTQVSKTTKATITQTREEHNTSDDQEQKGIFTGKWINSGRIFQRMKLTSKKKDEVENYYSVLADDIPIKNDNRIVMQMKLDMENEEMMSDLNLLKKRLTIEEVRTAEVEKDNKSLKRKVVHMKLKNMQLESAWMESQNMKKNTILLKEQFDVEATNVKVLKEFL